jgi:hypothetical protein
MTYETYFEIGGHILESTFATAENPRPRINTANNLQTTDLAVAVAPGAVAKSAGKKSYDAKRATRAPARARRAKWAFTLAASMALADGPLPIGDAIAIMTLSAYAGYELGMAYKDVRQN